VAIVTLNENDQRIWNEELKDFLPEKIIDIHTHVWLKELNLPTPTGYVPFWTDFVADENSWEDLKETYETLFPGKLVTPLMFTNGLDDQPSEANNDYVSKSSKITGWPALYYSHPYQSADEVEAKIREGGFLGIKSFLSLAPSYIPRNEVRIFDFFPKHQLERMNEMGAIVMCHIPRPGRLKDPVNLEQILEIRREFPKVKLIIAHIGRSYVNGDIGNAFTDYLKKEPETMYDFSANCSESAITELLQAVGPKHVMFGTDMPILRMRCNRIEENGTYINRIPKGAYGDVSCDSHMREVDYPEADKITFFAYEELLAFKRSCKTLGLSKKDVEDIMYNNANQLIEESRTNIYVK